MIPGRFRNGSGGARWNTRYILYKKLEKEFRKKDVSKPPKLRHESVARIDRALALAGASAEKPIHPQVFREARGKLVVFWKSGTSLYFQRKITKQYFTDKHLERKGFRQGMWAIVMRWHFHALSESPNFEMLVRSSCRRFPDGTWKVRIPLLDERVRRYQFLRKRFPVSTPAFEME